MIPYFASHLAFYILLVSHGGPEIALRIEGGYDSCLVARHTVVMYGSAQSARCISGIEWDKTGRPGMLAAATEGEHP